MMPVSADRRAQKQRKQQADDHHFFLPGHEFDGGREGKFDRDQASAVWRGAVSAVAPALSKAPRRLKCSFRIRLPSISVTVTA